MPGPIKKLLHEIAQSQHGFFTTKLATRSATSKTDEHGKAIHGNCYVLKVQLEQASKDRHEA